MRAFDADHWPRACASAVIFRGEDVLLIERARGALAGLWSLPGGHIEPGEPAAAAAVREVREETGVEAHITGLVDVHDVIQRRADGALAAHYVLAVFAGRHVAGDPIAASDAAAARFVPLREIGALPLTPEAERLIRAAFARLAK